MMRKASMIAAAVAAGLALTSTSGMAATVAPLVPLKSIAGMQSMVEQAHFWHRTCRRGLNGWHKHVPGVGRVQCTNHVCKHGKCWWY
jgi:hypothetical protein